MKKTQGLKTKSKRLFTTPALCTTTFLLLAVCFLPLTTASSSTPCIQLPERPVTMIVTDGTSSYFDIELSDVPAGLDLENGSSQGWCADRSVVMPRGEHLTVRFYSSYDASLPTRLREKNWSKVNYILNHKDGATKTDLQDAFWYLLCKYPSASITSNAQRLADTASEDFIPQPGELIAILAQPIRNESNPWPFQIAFVETKLPSQESIEPDEQLPAPTRISHGLHYNDIAPIADANGPYSGFAKEPLEFDGSASTDSDGIIIFYHWSFGDGATTETPTAAHSYSHDGIYQVSLKVTDNFGISDSDMTTVTITNRNIPPANPLISGPANGSTHIDYSYTFMSSDQNQDDLIYRVDWGDGTTFETGMLPSGQYIGLSHRWTTQGSYTITVTASDGSLVAVSEKDVVINEMLLTDNILIVGLALLALIALLATLLYAKKAKNKK